MMDTKTKHNDITITAHHEAGHAVMAILLGLPFKFVTVIPDPRTKTLGCIEMAHDLTNSIDINTTDIVLNTPNLKRRQCVEHHLMSEYAGPLAQRRYQRRCRSNRSYETPDAPAPRLDRGTLLNENIRHFGGWSRQVRIHWLYWLRSRTAEMVHEHWPEIRAVAEALVDREQLDSDEVRAVVNELLQATESRSNHFKPKE